MPERSEIWQAVAAALNSDDMAALNAVLPEVAPAPEVPERFVTVPEIGPVPARRHALTAAQAWLALGRDTPPQGPLRRHAARVRGALALAAIADLRDDALALAQRDAQVLREAIGDLPYAPFPDMRGAPGRMGELSQTAARLAEACGRGLSDGWFALGDVVPDETFYDTGLAMEALADLAAVTGDAATLGWPSTAAAWLADQPLSANFNYNAFVALGFSALGRAEGDPGRVQDAADWLRRGVLPGMIASGPEAGLWRDSHNQRIVYRVIMLRAMDRVVADGDALGVDVADIADAATLARHALATQIESADGVTSPQSLWLVLGPSDVGPRLDHALRYLTFVRPSPGEATAPYLATLLR